MDRVNDLTQAYSQAPWRKQLQLLGLFLLFLVFIALIAGIYLDVNARADAIGREVLHLQKNIEKIGRTNADLQAQLAAIDSATEMKRRAVALGFEPIASDQPVYISVQGYVNRQPIILAPQSSTTLVGAPVLPAEYTESLFEWLGKQLKLSSLSPFEVQP
jgi:hypothetical protein